MLTHPEIHDPLRGAWPTLGFVIDLGVMHLPLMSDTIRSRTDIRTLINAARVMPLGNRAVSASHLDTQVESQQGNRYLPVFVLRQ